MADVSRPRISFQPFLGCFRQFHRIRHIILFRRVHRKLLEEQHHVVSPFAKSRHLDGNRVQAIEQVLTETAVADGLRHVDIGSRHDAHVCLAHVARTDPDVFARLQHTQQACLRGQGQLSHLIEKQRTSVGRPEIAFALSYRPGKSSFLMTEQFGIYRSLRNGTAIHGKVFLRLSQAVVVDNTGNDFLSHTALSGDQYG